MDANVEGFLLVYDWIGNRWAYYSFPLKYFSLEIKRELEDIKHLNIKGLGLLELRDIYGPEMYDGKYCYTVRAYLNDTYKDNPVDLLNSIQ